MSWFKNLFRRKWPKVIKIIVRDGDCNFLDSCFISINSWDEIMPQGEQFCQDVMSAAPYDENVDEVYWNYEVV